MRERPHRLVFIDETSVRANLTRPPGRSAVGRTLVRHDPVGRWQTQTFVAGLTCDALIAPRVTEGAMDRNAFDVDVETQLAPALSPGTVFVGNLIHWIKSSSSLLDILSIPKSPEAVEELNHHGCRLLSLPACSPDPNPIEMAFSKPKANLRRNGARPCDTLIQALADICSLFNPDECRNFFNATG